eukprot:292986_1
MDHFKEFNSFDDQCISNTPYINNCSHLKRLVHGLEYYTKLGATNDEFNEDAFDTFYNKQYQNALNDYIHLVTVHSEHLESINVDLIQNYSLASCDVTNCSLSARHYRFRNKNRKKQRKQININTDPIRVFFMDMFDSLHFYLFHLFHVGLRSFKNVNEEMNAVHKRKKYDLFDASDNTKQKFNIHIGHKESSKENTFIDNLLVYVSHNKGQINIIKNLYNFMHTEEYDTDAMIDDVEFNSNDKTNTSNILNLLKNERSHIILIEKYITNFKLKSRFFSAGMIFFYWDHYKHINSKTQTMSDIFYNVLDYDGYNIKQLYVQRKYESLKEETLYHIDIEQYEKVTVKSNKFINTDKAKQMISTTSNELPVHYDIKHGTALSVMNLTCIILYCDYSNLSTKFSSTFRAIHPLEPIESIKKRNSEFWWLSKTIHETVQYFGVDGSKQLGGVTLNGPFYCGINTVLNIPSFCIRLCAPTSTSKTLQIACNFAKRTGMIIKLNNNGSSDSHRLRAFYCSWISQYSEEDEYLYVGGYIRIRIQSILIIKTRQNFQLFMHALYVFDSMLNGTSLANSGFKVKSKDIKVINILLQKK